MSNQPINHRTITWVEFGEQTNIKLTHKPAELRKAIRRVMQMLNFRRAQIKSQPGVPFGRPGVEAVALITLLNHVVDLKATPERESK